MLEEFVDKLLEEVHSIVEMHQLHSNPLKYYSIQASLFSTAMTKLNKKVVSHYFNSIQEEISFFKNAKPKLLAELHYSHYRTQSLRHCQYISKGAKEKYIRYELQKIDAFFLEHKEFCSYLSIGEVQFDMDYFTRLSKRSNPKVNYYLGDKDYRSTCKKGHIIGKIISKKRLSIYFQSLLEKESLNGSPEDTISINKLNWNGSQTDLVELIYALKAAGCINDTLLNISDVLSQVFGSNNIDTYKVWNRIKNRKHNSTRLLTRLLESLIEQIEDEK